MPRQVRYPHLTPRLQKAVGSPPSIFQDNLFFYHPKTFFMVTVKSCVERIGKDEKTFISLELTGDIELVQSQNTGRFYATVRHCFISSTFDEPTAKQFIGKQLPGNIVRVETDPYDFVIPQTGEEVSLSHSWVYQPEVPKHHEQKRPEPSSKSLEFERMVSEM